MINYIDVYHGTTVEPNILLKQGLHFWQKQEYIVEVGRLISQSLGYLPNDWQSVANRVYLQYRHRHKGGLYCSATKAEARFYAVFSTGETVSEIIHEIGQYYQISIEYPSFHKLSWDPVVVNPYIVSMKIPESWIAWRDRSEIILRQNVPPEMITQIEQFTWTGPRYKDLHNGQWQQVGEVVESELRLVWKRNI